MIKNTYVLFFMAIFYCHSFYAKDMLDFEKDGQGKYRIVSYNLENLFDCEDDPQTNDESFTPEGDHQWTYGKYWLKLNNLSRAITAAGEWETPFIIGLCEVENAKVVSDLLNKTQLKNIGYQYIHKDSPDRRGVDVAMAYDPKVFHLISEEFIPVHLTEGRPTRDILHATGTILNGDTLHLFVNHWPSRYGGELESKDKRVEAGEILRSHTDIIMHETPNARIIIMGDFNDYPDDESLNYGLCAVSPTKFTNFGFRNDELYNLSYAIHEKGDRGSHNFGGKWGMLDQIIVSGTLLQRDATTFIQSDQLNICEASFLLKEGANGYLPKRSFLGTFFAYGYSDHLPIYIDLFITSK